MDQEFDPSKYERIQEGELREILMQTIHWRLRYLRWAPWRKHMTAEDVLKQHGINTFADEVAEHALKGLAVYRPVRDVGINPFAHLIIERPN